jgi:hypothetical protein
MFPWAFGQRGNLPVQPILLDGQRRPSIRHSHIAPEHRLNLGSFRELQAIFSALAHQV